MEQLKNENTKRSFKSGKIMENDKIDENFQKHWKTNKRWLNFTNVIHENSFKKCQVTAVYSYFIRFFKKFL